MSSWSFWRKQANVAQVSTPQAKENRVNRGQQPSRVSLSAYDNRHSGLGPLLRSQRRRFSCFTSTGSAVCTLKTSPSVLLLKLFVRPDFPQRESSSETEERRMQIKMLERRQQINNGQRKDCLPRSLFPVLRGSPLSMFGLSLLPGRCSKARNERTLRFVRGGRRL